MTPQSTAGADQARNDQAQDDQAERVWAAMRELTDGYPPKDALRGALNLGRGSGRVKALLWLAEGPLSLSGIAEAVGVDAPYATLIVDTLEARGLVERRADPADRRRKLVSLTSEGKEAVARVVRIQRRPPPGFGRLTPAELDTLEKLLGRVTGATPTPADPPDPPGSPGSPSS
jgi:DNA-binding MarR family transcriptional regulator